MTTNADILCRQFLVRALIPFEAMAILAAFPASSRAGAIGVQAQALYEFDQVNRRDTGTTGRGFLVTNYNLSLRRRFMPASILMSDLSINGSGNGGVNGTQNAAGWTLNLLAEQSRYMLTGRVVRNNYNSSFGPGASSRGSATYYNAGIFLRQPAYPVLSLQFQRNAAESRFADSTAGNTATTWLTSLAYARTPIRFSYDRSQQSISATASPGSHVTSQTSALTLDQPLLPGLELFGEMSRSASDVSFVNGSTSMKTTRRVLRLTATPTRSVVAEVDLTSETNNQRVLAVRGRNSSTALGWSVRSEVLPGLSLDVADQRQSLSGSGFFSGLGTVTRNRNIALSARLSQYTILSATAARQGFGSPIDGGDVTQDSVQTSVQTSMSRFTDLSVNYGKNRSRTGLADRFDSVSEGVSIRDRRSSRLTVGVAYRHMNLRSSTAGVDTFTQRGDSVDLDALAQAGYRMSLGLRLSYQNNTGSSPFRTVAPGVNLRMQVDSATSLTASWTGQRFRQYDPISGAGLGQDTRGLSARLTHTFVNGSFLDVAYDFQGNSVSDTRWRRLLRVGFTVNR